MIQSIIINLLLLLLPCTLFARAQPEELIHLQADSIQYNFKKGIIYYTGHVHATRHLTELYADTMTVFYRHNKIEKILAVGNPAYFSTRPNEQKDSLNAWARKIIYFPISAQVELINNVKVQQRENFFSGPKLFYDMKKQHVLSKANQQSKAQLIIEPFNNLQNDQSR